MKIVALSLMSLLSLAATAECRIPNSNVSYQARCAISETINGRTTHAYAYASPSGFNDIAVAKTPSVQVAIVTGQDFKKINFYIKVNPANLATFRQGDTTGFADVCDRTDVIYDETYSHIRNEGTAQGRITCVLEKQTYQD